MTRFAAPIAEQIWNKKYRFKEADGTPIDPSIRGTWTRIADALAQAEAPEEREKWAREFYSALEDFKFIPAGRIVAGAGTGRNVTLMNCFVMGTIPDNMEGIFQSIKEAALTMQQGGGIGYDFSTLRPKGALVKGVAADASGPLSFMDVWDSMCRTIMSAGSRRGAMMATMRVDHPDIEDFITAKHDSTKLRMFNLSVLVTDDFMDAVKFDTDFRLHFENRHGETLVEKTVSARELWNKIMRSTYEVAEPGVIFIDRINSLNPLNYCEKIASSNPCGEQPLPPFGSCLLGSINLTRFVLRPFTGSAEVSKRSLREVVRTAVRMMDNVIDVTNFPLPQQAEEARQKRRIGLGVTGLADALLMLGITYGSAKAVLFVDQIMSMISHEAYLASSALAVEKGAFPLFSAEHYAESEYLARFDKTVRESVTTYGLRNALLTSIAPTGTISLMAGNVSSGIEPVFAYSYIRKVLQDDGSRVEERVEDYAYAIYRSEIDPDMGNMLPDYFVSAQTLPPEAHVMMQAAAQKWVDSSISKTVNCPEDITFDDFKAIYEMAYDEGCKGCTTYRPNDVTGSVLSVDAAPAAAPEPVVQQQPTASPVSDQPAPRPEALDGQTYKLKWPGSDHALYVTINDIERDGMIEPFEIFFNSKDTAHYAYSVALSRMISAVFRRGGNVGFVAEELKAVFDPMGGAWMGGKYVPSILAAIGGVIERHIGEDTLMNQQGEHAFPAAVAAKITTPCPKCSSYNTKNESGCFQCLDCGESKCG